MSVCQFLHLTRTSSVLYLWVMAVSSQGVTSPALNISQPAWAIIAPLSIQNLARGLINSGQIVDAVPHVRGEQRGAALLAHDPHHLLQPEVAAHTCSAAAVTAADCCMTHLPLSAPRWSRSAPWPAPSSPPTSRISSLAERSRGQPEDIG